MAEVSRDSGETPAVDLDVHDNKHLEHLVMTLHLSPEGLDIQPSQAARALIDQDLRAGREEARHLPVVGWLLERAMVFAEHRMTDYFGLHSLRYVNLRFDGTTLSVQIGHAWLDLGKGEVDPAAAGTFYQTFRRLKAG
jgi:hypothetical protein